jgi:hypothetical protein
MPPSLPSEDLLPKRILLFLLVVAAFLLKPHLGFEGSRVFGGQSCLDANPSKLLLAGPGRL